MIYRLFWIQTRNLRDNFVNLMITLISNLQIWSLTIFLAQNVILIRILKHKLMLQKIGNRYRIVEVANFVTILLRK